MSWLPSPIDEARPYPPSPEGLVLYAIGDIHGRADCLQQAFATIDEDRRRIPGHLRKREVYLGDYVDRGPRSAAVIDALLERAEGRDVVFIRGNHEILLESYLRGLTPFEEWRRLGGLETVLSYGVDAKRHLDLGDLPRIELARQMPASHFRFLSELRPYYEAGAYCFVHAGLRPGLPLENQSMEDLAWIRRDFLEAPGPFSHVVVHGHTPVAKVDLRPQRINIDTGAYMTSRLSVIRIDADGVLVLPS